jgi:serine/threonine protein kinase
MTEHDMSTAPGPGARSHDSYDGAVEEDPAFRLLLQQTQHAVQKQVHGIEPSTQAAGEHVFLGRYRVESFAGKGAMGTVLAAEDVWLERRVALKLVNTPGAQQRRRLVREGISLAKLSHPNVVQVHDVELGERGEQAYVVMEYVEGSTLARWQSSKPRSPGEIIGKYLQAARGLWAAHQVGIVHRDFKPHNVLINASGVVKVADFGLASAIEPEVSEGGDVLRATVRADTAPEARAATATETSVGLTPGYCAPEQLRGERPTPRADQFALCVALYEALTGSLPFGSSRVLERYEREVAAGIGGRAEASKIPRRVYRALAQGLALQSARRFDDMSKLIAVLEPRPSQWPWAAAVLVPMAALLTRALVPSSMVEVEVDPCSRPDDELPLERSPAAAVSTTPWEFIDARATSYRESWREASESLCRSTRRGELGSSAQAQAQACLDTAAREFNLVLKLVAAEGSTTDPFAALGNLHAPERCTQGGGRPAFGSADPALQRELDETRALQLAGRNEEALARARALHEQARAVADVVVMANVSFLIGKLESLTGAGDSAARDLEEASLHAETLGDDILALDAIAELIDVAANLSVDPAAGVRWEKLGQAKLERSGVQSSEVAGQYYSAAANLAFRRGEFSTALEHGRHAYELLRESSGEDSIATLAARTNHAVALVGAERPREAIAEYLQILEVRRRRYGEQHITTLYDELRLARARMEAKEHEQALAGFARVEKLAPTTTKEGERLQAFAAVRQCEVLVNRALEASGSMAQASPVCARASSMMPRLEGNDRRLVEERSILYGKQGVVLAGEGHNERALELLERERELLLLQVPTDPARLAYNTTIRCLLLHDLGRTAECAVALEQNHHWYEASGRQEDLPVVRGMVGLDRPEGTSER